MEAQKWFKNMKEESLFKGELHSAFSFKGMNDALNNYSEFLYT